MENKNKQSGFTLIEMLVSVSIFVVVALIVSIVFVSLAQANRRARNIKLLVDNVNFAMDTMVLDLKSSTSFHCAVGPDDNCTSLDYTPLVGGSGNFHFVQDSAGQGSINQSVGSLVDRPLTSPQINIKDLYFKLINVGGENKQQGVYVYVQAFAVERNTKVDFSLQTFISARNP